MIRDTFDVDPDKGFVMLTGQRSIVAQVERRLRYFRGEFWLNPLAGIPWDLLLGHQSLPNQLGAEISAEIADKDGVQSVEVTQITEPETKRSGIEIELEVDHAAGRTQITTTVGN